jgi:hypothetical protein
MRQAILAGAHQGAQGAINLTRVSEVTQKPDELPSQFYDRLCDAYHRYTPFEPEVSKNRFMINTAFVQQSVSDVRQKLQKMEGFIGANIDQLISIVAPSNEPRRDGQKRERKISGQKAKILAMALKEGDGKTRGWKGGPQQERTEKPSGKSPVHLL